MEKDVLEHGCITCSRVDMGSPRVTFPKETFPAPSSEEPNISAAAVSKGTIHWCAITVAWHYGKCSR